jgi:AraC-like DNA-binding protein
MNSQAKPFPPLLPVISRHFSVFLQGKGIRLQKNAGSLMLVKHVRPARTAHSETFDRQVLFLQIVTTTQEILAMAVVAAAVQRHSFAFTRTVTLVPFVNTLLAREINPHPMLSAAGIDQELLDYPSAIISLDKSFRFAERAAAASGDPCLGFTVGMATHLNHLGPYGRHLSAMRTIAEYLIEGVRYYNRLTSGLSLRLSAGEGYWRVSQAWFDGSEATRGQVHAHLNTLAITLNTCRQAAGKDWLPPAIHITNRCNGELPSVELTACKSLSQQTADTWLEIPVRILRLPLGGDDSRCPEGYQRPLSTSLIDCVREQTQALSTHAELGIGTIARSLDINRRTLQRHLSSQGVSFSALLAGIRRQLALQMLSETEKSVIEIAIELGYSDPSNFTRAFKRWNGISPCAYRNAFQQSESTAPRH